MITVNTYKALLVGVLICLSTSAFASDLSCKDVLKDKIKTVRVYRDTLRDFEALEVTAAVALALELKISVTGNPTGRYSSIPRIRYEHKGEISLGGYDFNSITEADKEQILEDLPELMERALKEKRKFLEKVSGRLIPSKNKLGREFHERFSSGATKDLLIRNEVLLRDFLEENFETIVFNAASMPTKALLKKILPFLKRGAKLGVPIALVGGGLLELASPSIFFEWLLPNYLYDSIDYSFVTKTAMNAAPLLPVFVTPAGFLTHGKERFTAFYYDFDIGRETRNDYARATVDLIRD